MKPGDTFTVQVPQWLADQEKLASRSLSGVVKITTPKAVHVEAWATVAASQTCHRCHRGISDAGSILVGYGPDCAVHLGIPHLTEAELTAELVEQIRASVKVRTQWKGWLPVGKITLLEVNGEAVAAPVFDNAVAGNSGTAPAPTPAYLASPAHQALDRAKVAATPVDVPIVVTAGLSVDGERLEVLNHPFSADLNQQYKALGAYWDPGEKVWWWKVGNAQTAARLVRSLQDTVGISVLTPDLTTLLERAVAEDTGDPRRRDDLPDIPSLAPGAWQHQRRAFWYALNRPATMLALGMGTGKTRTMLGLIAQRRSRMNLIICPLKAVYDAWERQLAQHFPHRYVVALLGERVDGTEKKLALAQRKLQEAEALGYPLFVVVNYRSACIGDLYNWLRRQDWEEVVLDESQHAKSSGSITSKCVVAIGHRARYRTCLTGTPLADKPIDAFAQYKFLDSSIFGTNKALFMARYCIRGGPDGNWVMGYTNLEEFQEKFFSIAYAVSKAEAMPDLPLEMEERITFDLSTKARKHYEDMEKRYYAELETGILTAPNVLARNTRLHQITSGFLPDPLGVGVKTARESAKAFEGFERVDFGKAEALREKLEEIGDEPVVVFCEYRHDIEVIREICDDLKIGVGEVSGNQRHRGDLEHWQEGLTQVLIVQERAGAEAINLTRARYQIYYSVNFSLNDFDQSKARIHRGGQTRPVTYYYLVARGTVDVDIYDALSKKRDVVQYIMEKGMERVKAGIT